MRKITITVAALGADRPHRFLRALPVVRITFSDPRVDFTLGPDTCGKEITFALTTLTAH